ncbi:MAG: Tc toxin subunit A, partial [Bacteroidota bacterium]
MERVMSVTPQFDKINTVEPLWQANIRSSRDIHRMGETGFVEAFTTDLGASEARAVYNRAAQSSAMALNTMATFGSSFNSVLPSVIRPSLFSSSDGIPGIPNLETLFGSQDLCQCKHCRSVYSPAAYMVDLLSWLGEIKWDDNGTQRTLTEALLDRRPDIGNIKLTCDNTNVPMPYIDLVNEVLEVAVRYQEDTGYSPAYNFQSELDAKALRAHPENIMPEAYAHLTNKVFPWGVPFSLWKEEAHTYLQHLGVPYDRLLSVLPPAGATITDAEVAARYLGMTALERALVVHDTSTINTLVGATTSTHHYYGYASSSSISQLEDVENLMKRSGRSFDELSELVTSKFVNPTAKFIFFPTPSCGLDSATLNFDSNEFRKLYRFWRLQQKTGWSVADLDRALFSFFEANAPATDITDDCLIFLANVKRLEEKYRVPVKEILSWWVTVDTTDYPEDTTFYDDLFLNKTVNNPSGAVEAIFQLNGFNSELVTTTHPINDVVNTHYILAAVNITAEELDLIASTELNGSNIHLKNLSQIFRIASFSRALGISIRDYLRLKSITGLPGITSYDGTTVVYAQPADTLAFVDILEDIETAGFSIESLDYLLLHQAMPNSPAALDVVGAGLMLKSLRDELQKVREELTIVGDTNLDKVSHALGILLRDDNTWTETQITETLSLLKEEDVLANQTAFNNLIDNHFITFLPDQGDRDDMKDILTDANNINGNYLAGTEVRAQHLLVSGLLQAYIESTVVPKVLRQTIREACANYFAMDSDITASILAYPINPSVPATTFETVFLDGPTFVDTTGAIDLTSGTFSIMAQTMELLFRISAHVRTLHIRVGELPFLFDTINLGLSQWYDLRDLALPINPATDFATWLKMVRTYNLNQLHATDQTSMVELLLSTAEEQLANNTTTARALAESLLQEITGWTADDITFLVGTSGYNFAATNLN